MSIDSLQKAISRLQNEILRLQKKKNTKQKEQGVKSTKIIRIQNSITKHTNLSSRQNKLKEIHKREIESNKISSQIVDIDKEITKKNERLNKYQQDLQKLEVKEQKKRLEQIIRDQKNILGKESYPMSNLNFNQTDESTQLHDFFISHASEDKGKIANPLANELKSLGYDVWYDEFQLKIGDSLRRSIDKGLAKSKFGIVILSPSFFAKGWTEYELNGLVQREISNNSKVILPIWHEVSKDQVMSYSPSLADKLALNTTMLTIQELAEKISEVLGHKST